MHLLLAMRLFSFASLITATFLSILCTGPAAFALTKTESGKDASYRRLEHQFVLSPRNEVVVLCDAGDTLLSGSCDGRAENIISQQSPLLNEAPHPANRQMYIIDARAFESREINELGQAGFACRAKIVRADQEMRITAAAKCRKSSEKAVHLRRLIPQS